MFVKENDSDVATAVKTSIYSREEYQDDRTRQEDDVGDRAMNERIGLFGRE